jgi:light-regulated signal transduction histidine kinase (bacteriophytochrome)
MIKTRRKFFVSSEAAHKLKNQLTIISLSVGILKKKANCSSNQKLYLSKIEKKTKTLTKLIDKWLIP